MTEEAKTWKEWGVQYTSPFGSHVVGHLTKDEAVHQVRFERPAKGCTIALVSRDCTRSDWRLR